MVRLAAAQGIDLSDWASTTLRKRLVDEADLIFAMEASHLVRLHEDHPTAADRSFLLGAVTSEEDGPLEIADPFGRADAVYERCIREVTGAVRRIVDRMRRSPRGAGCVVTQGAGHQDRRGNPSLD
jgi:protein-tyrosine-phosphatase